METIELPCTVTDCTYKTPALPPQFAFQQMGTHRGDAHPTINAPAAPVVTATTPKPEKVARPTFDLNQSVEKWKYYQTRWNTYKTATGLTGNNIQIQLLETCSDNLRFALYQSDASINTKSEVQILAAMKKLAVKEENQLVSRMKLGIFNQEPGEAVNKFASRLQGQAELCTFTEKCTACNIDIRFTHQMVRDNLVRGLYDQDIQREVLGMEDQTMNLDNLLKLLEAKEAGRRTQATILGRGVTAAAMSSYKTNEKRTNLDNCSYCGKSGHGKNEGPGRNSLQLRQAKCPAFTIQCNICSRKGHFTQLCRSKNKDHKKSDVSKQGALSEEAAIAQESAYVYEELCSASVEDDFLEPDHTFSKGVPVPQSEDLSVIESRSITIDAEQHDSIDGFISSCADALEQMCEVSNESQNDSDSNTEDEEALMSINRS